MLSAITTGGGPDAYAPDGIHGHSLAEFLRPFERTARLCHMEWLEPQVLQGVWKATDADLRDAARTYRQRLESLRVAAEGPEA